MKYSFCTGLIIEKMVFKTFCLNFVVLNNLKHTSGCFIVEKENYLSTTVYINTIILNRFNHRCIIPIL